MSTKTGRARSSSASDSSATDERPQKAGARISEHKLRNGMRVLVAERHLDPVVAVMVWYGVGSRNERDEEAGVSHFLEHMMFKGSKSFGKGEVDHLTTTLGGSNNAHTGPDHTAYWFEFASDRWESALEIEADRMRTLTIDPAEFASEKAVVLEELAMGEDDPWQNLTRQMQEVLFSRHPYRRPIIGYADVLEAMTPDAMRAYYERFYHPSNAILVVCGDVKPQAVMKAARKHFGSIPAGPALEMVDCFRPEIEEPRSARRVHTNWDDPGTRVALAWPTVAVGEEIDYVLDLVSSLLTTGRLSRLYRSLVMEQGIATYVGSSNDARVDGGSFWIYAEAVQGVSAERVEAAIKQEIQLMIDEGVSAEDLKRAKKTLASTEAFEGETVSDLAEQLGSFAIDRDWRIAIDVSKRRQKVTAKAVRAACESFLVEARSVIGVSLPVAEGVPA
ncbi:MAG: zinc protease [Planctomycetota bacterium]|jgi:zinc protease